MDGSQHTIARDGNGRFVPGCSGNPAGKRPGTRNRASILAEALRCGEAENIARVVIEKAVSGDAMAARFCLDRLSPRPRGRAIRLELPEGESAGGDVVAMFNSALRAMAAGEITPDEAVTVARFLEGRFRVLRAWQLERKLTTYRDQPPIPGDDFLPGEDADADAKIDGAGAPPLTRPSVGAGLAPARSAAQDGSEGGPGQARPLPPQDLDDAHDCLHRTCISPASPARSLMPDESDDGPGQTVGQAPPRWEDEPLEMLFDENGKFQMPPNLTLPQMNLLSDRLSEELQRRRSTSTGAAPR